MYCRLISGRGDLRLPIGGGLALTAFLIILLGVNAVGNAEEAPDFNREIRPLLAQYCFKCHGADEHTREAGFRLDDRDSAVGLGDSGQRIIQPGSPAGSQLITRIFSENSDEVMPPTHSKTVMPDSGKELIRRWIEAGAKYDKHWAYSPPDPGAIARILESRDRERAKLHPIDFFVREQLETRQLGPSPRADKYTLVRRLYLDLIGLPPTLDQADAFVTDNGADAYDRLVDQLLDSPRYGERWARRWLDLARYADTNGFEKDRPRNIWPYRDWVIRALNQDMPYDQFSIKQLAGDLLEDPTADDLVATGFNRNTMLNEEGGIDPLEYRFYAMVDRVGVTGTTWLGLTLNCCQCHSHKYDPIQHVDFYRLMAFLNNADEPNYYIPSNEVQVQQQAYAVKIRELESGLEAKFPGGADALQAALAKWIDDQSSNSSDWQVITPNRIVTSMPHLEIQNDGFLLGSGDITKSDIYELDFKAPIGNVRAIRLEVSSHPSLPNDGPGLTDYEGPLGGFFLSEIQAEQSGQSVEIANARATNDEEEDRISDATPAKKKVKTVAKKNNAGATLDGEMSSGWQVLGGIGVQHAAVFQLDQPIDLEQGLRLKMFFEKHFACPLGHFRISVTTSDHATATGQPAEIEAILAIPAERRNQEQTDLLKQRYLETCPELKEFSTALWEARRKPPRGQPTLVMRERPVTNPRKTYRFHRGEYLNPREEVTAGIPTFLPAISPELPLNRLSFAKWLFSPGHPLTARVAVNRQWQAFFGRGIVNSLEDFGYQSESPSHPELLDWLALEFQKNDWSIKKLHRTIVTSQTYQQASSITDEMIQKDPNNVWLSRNPRFRLDAEVIRDSALQAAGVLSTKMFGPGVYPPQPASVTTEGTYGRVEWKVSEGEDRFRRSIYTFMKRTAPFAMATTFDAPSGESCLARRDVSNSPLQALTLLNDQMFLEASQEMAKSVISHRSSDTDRIQELFRRCVTRPADEAELESIQLFVRQLMQQGLEPQRVWTLVGRALLNLDEAITHP